MKNKYHCVRHHHRIHLIHFHCVRRVWSASFCIGWYVVVENTNLFSQWEKRNDECRQEIESDTPFNVIPPNSQSFIINIYLNTTQQNTRERHTSAAATARTQSNEKTTKSFSRDISDFSTNCFSYYVIFDEPNARLPAPEVYAHITMRLCRAHCKWRLEANATYSLLIFFSFLLNQISSEPRTDDWWKIKIETKRNKNNPKSLNRNIRNWIVAQIWTQTQTQSI